MKAFPKRPRRLLLALVCAALFLPHAAAAIDVGPTDYVPAPAGSDALLLYYRHAESSHAHLTTSGRSDNSGLSADSGILRYIHYAELGGMTIAPQILVPAAALHDTALNGSPLNQPGGLGDVILANVFWLENNPAQKRYFGVTPYVWLPVGRYDLGQSLNIGENRWKANLQAGLDQGFGDQWAVNLTVDATWYGDNTEAGTGDQTLKQDVSSQIQAWLRYDLSAQASLAAGLSQTLGGKQTLDGAANGFKTEVTQARLSYSQFLTPSFQVQGILSSDLRTRGGFDEDYGAQLRLLKVF